MSWAVAVTGGAAPIYVGYRWWRRHQREQQILQELERVNDEAPRIPEHLDPQLAALARQTHRLRLELETPVRRIRAPLLSETPWARRQRCDEYDAALYEVRQAIWEWLRSLRRLGVKERRLLGELGLSVAPFRRLLFGCDRTDDVWEQVVYARAPNLDLVWTEVRRTISELERFERALLSAPVDPYR
ncbi:hypothetical protein DB30_07622 [Enhygromyxa salina]|uniref:Uncharacterized protein n=1 Tax=Enhygromyxa salina TaxID=215803 RepID=A0A0C2CRH7_9BACT|nr:hypothetical protein [Enhygromyxa salina]KIG13776.1 hypothetical protein DB30_07622 [Enhygromyxa salina]